MICTKASATLMEVVNVNTVKKANNVLIRYENHFYLLDPFKGAQSVPPPGIPNHMLRTIETSWIDFWLYHLEAR